MKIYVNFKIISFYKRTYAAFSLLASWFLSLKVAFESRFLVFLTMKSTRNLSYVESVFSPNHLSSGSGALRKTSNSIMRSTTHHKHSATSNGFTSLVSDKTLYTQIRRLQSWPWKLWSLGMAKLDEPQNPFIPGTCLWCADALMLSLMPLPDASGEGARTLQ